MPTPDYNPRQERYQHRAQRMMREGGGRLSDFASCLGCLLKLIVLVVIFVVLVTAAGAFWYHFTTHKPIHW